MHPIGARTANQMFGNLYTTKCSEMFMIKNNKKPITRATHDESLELPVSTPKEIQNPTKGLFPNYFWDIYWIKRREKAWLVADKLYRPSEPNKG
ncbi:hypothetical protein ACEPAG_8469 [Sanghuangporus baumii]